jgi:hypothetical protein
MSTNGQLLIGGTSGPAAATLTAGSNVTITNALVWAQGDDAFDIDQAFFGTFDNFISIEGSDSDHALEIDGGEGNWNAEFEMLDGTLISIDGSECHFRDGAIGYIEFAGQANTEADSGTSAPTTKG